MLLIINHGISFCSNTKHLRKDIIARIKRIQIQSLFITRTLISTHSTTKRMIELFLHRSTNRSHRIPSLLQISQPKELVVIFPTQARNEVKEAQIGFRPQIMGRYQIISIETYKQ